MSPTLFRLSLLSLALTMAAPAIASANPIAKSLGNLRWGMSDSEVASMLKRKVKERYRDKLKKASGAKKEQLEREARQKLSQLDREPIAFNGKRTRWDTSSVADEYMHGNRESMIAFNDGEADNYYFFFDGELWKWVKSYPASTFGGRDFKRFEKTLNRKFGKGREKQGEYYPGQNYRWVEYMDRNTRLRGVDKTSNYGEWALVFEQMETVRSLSSLRASTTRKNSPKRSEVASKEPEPSEPRVGKPPARSLRLSDKRSVIGNSGRNESDEEYAERKRRTIEEKRNKQRRIYERQQEEKKGKVLDDLAGIDNDDPIDGM